MNNQFAEEKLNGKKKKCLVTNVNINERNSNLNNIGIPLSTHQIVNNF